MKKIPLCILCLARENKDHECPVGKCAKCGGHHNISFCPKNEEEGAFKIGENEDDSTDSEDEEMEDYTANRESVNVITRGRESTKPKDKERPRKEGKETKDGNEASDKESKEVKLSKLRSILKTVATGHELGKKHSAANKTNVSSLEKACMIRESQSAETITDFISDED